jgi:uncharacterized protein (UPF0335 family)
MNKLRTFAERIERLHEEKRSIEEDIKEVYAELAAEGYDKKAMREVIKRRSKDPLEACEFEAIVELYLQEINDPSRAYTRDARDTREANHVRDAQRTSNRDVSAVEKPYSGAGPQAEALHAGTGSETLAVREVRIEEHPGSMPEGGVRTAPPIAKPYDPGPIPAFLDRRINKPEAAA